MNFKFIRIDDLPRLAWCAEFSDKESVHVYHGPWVETGEDCFFEAAWNDDYEEGRFDKATTLIGTGARITDDKVRFSTSTDLDIHLYSATDHHKLYVSNSLVFVMVMAKTKPDIRYPYYLYDYFAFSRYSLSDKARRLRTADKKPLYAHIYKKFSVSKSLDIENASIPHPPQPNDYESYITILRSTMQAVFENANHHKRIKKYSPITTLSRGYDSSAVSALASELGCRDALCFNSKHYGTEDFAGENAKMLGLNLLKADHFDFHKISGFPEAEFCASAPSGGGMALAPYELNLEAKIFLHGDLGDRMWGINDVENVPQLRWPQLNSLTPASMNEFRLRTGILLFNVPAIGAFHCQKIHSISKSDEMRKWSVKEEYNRPIARRIAEEAGLPRYNFGQKKMFGMVLLANLKYMKPGSVTDFWEFYQAADIPWWFRHLPWYLR